MPHLNGSFGTVTIPIDRVVPRGFDQVLPGYRAGPETAREAQVGVQKAVLGGDFTAGLQPRDHIAFWLSPALRSYVYNPGYQTRPVSAGLQPPPSLPYVVETETSITNAADPDTDNADNNRVHGIVTDLGGSVYRFYAGKGVNFFRNSNSGGTKSAKSTIAAAVSCNVDGGGASVTLPGRVTAIAVTGAPGGSGRALYLGLEDYGVVYTTDPTASPVVFTMAVDLASGDRIDVLDPQTTIHGGVLTMIGAIDGVTSHWWQKTSEAAPWSMNEAVESGTHNEPNPDGVAVTREYAPEIIINNSTLGTTAWTNPANAKASDDSRAGGPTANTSQLLESLGFDLSSIPDGSLPVGLRIPVEARRSGGAASCSIGRVAFWLAVDRSALDTDAADITEVLNAWPNTDWASAAIAVTTEQDYFIGSASVLPFPVTIAELKSYLFAVAIQMSTASATTGDVDFGPRLELTWIPPGVGIGSGGGAGGQGVGLGGYGIGHAEDEERVTYHVAPESDDPDGITVPRKPYKVTWLPLSDGRVVITREPVSNGLDYTWDAAAHLGGLASTGDHTATPGRLLTLLNRDGRRVPIPFPAADASNELRINSLIFSQDLWLGAELVASDFSDRQWAFVKDGVFYTDTLPQSKSEHLLTAQPIAWAEKAYDIENDRIYSFVPNGSNGLAVVRQFLPRDLGANPRLTDVSEVRSKAWSGNEGSRTEDTDLILEVGYIDYGAIEVLKAQTAVDAQTLNISADGAGKGVIHYLARTDGAKDLTNPDIDESFNGSTQFESREIAGTAPFQVQYVGLSASHDAGSAETPDLGPFLVSMKQKFRPLITYDVQVDISAAVNGAPPVRNRIVAFIQSLYDEATYPKSVVQVTDLGELIGTVMTSFEGPVQSDGTPVRLEDLASVSELWLRFTQVQATAA